MRWSIDPIKLFNCLKVFGAESFSIASVFLMSGVVSLLVTLNPNHSICLQANLHCSSETARFSSFNLSKTAFSFYWCNSVDPLVTISMSFKYAYVFVQFVKVKSIAF